MGAGHGRSWQSRELGVPCLGLKRSPRSRGRCSCGSPLPGPDASARGVRPGQGRSLQPRGAGGPLPRPDTSAGGLRPGQGADPVIGDRRVMRVNSSGRGIRPGRGAEPGIGGI